MFAYYSTGYSFLPVINSYTIFSLPKFLKNLNISRSYSDYLLCANLEAVEIPNYVTSFGSETFRNCKTLTDIDIPKSVTTLGDAVLSIAMSCCKPNFRS